METISALLALYEGNPPVTGGFPSQRQVTGSFGVFFDLHLAKRLNKQSRRQWFETPSYSLWCHCDEHIAFLMWRRDVPTQWLPMMISLLRTSWLSWWPFDWSKRCLLRCYFVSPMLSHGLLLMFSFIEHILLGKILYIRGFPQMLLKWEAHIHVECFVQSVCYQFWANVSDKLLGHFQH